MSLSTSRDGAPDIGDRVEGSRSAVVTAREPRDDNGSGRLLKSVYFAGILITAALFFAGAWQRRWIADDGLIVLRTVRNLFAGNGPVFNAHERVETNTSAAWTYVVYAFSWITQARLEYVVLGIALTLSVLAIVLAMLGSGRLWTRGNIAGRRTLLLPAGALVYIAVPPARDYATSGLETCLVIFWIALLWLLLIRWSQSERPGTPMVLGLAFVAGLGPLVRPEMLILASLVLLLVFLAPQPILRRVAMVFVAGVLPVGYQIWRMGYYALPYPNTAVAKDATGSKWGQGMLYLWNLVGPYFLWVPLLVLAIAAFVIVRGNRERRASAVAERSTVRRLQSKLHSPTAVVTLMIVAAVILGLYTLRVGGDFMHGRMLLPELFLLMLPVSVIPLRLPDRSEARRFSPVLAAGAVAWIVTVVWALVAANTTGMATGTTIGKSGIVDERAYYVLNTGHDHPIRASDYLDYPRMRAMLKAIADTPDGGVLLATPSYMTWDVVPPPAPIPPGGVGHTVYFLNLGMTSMNVPLDVRVIDQEGLAYPLAAHTDRLTDGRIGHDKNLFPDWVVADLKMVDKHPWLPSYLDEDWVTQAEVAVSCPQTQDLLTSYRSDLTWDRWKQNFRQALTLAKYRIDRVPKYEIERCHLPKPVLKRGY